MSRGVKRTLRLTISSDWIPGGGSTPHDQGRVENNFPCLDTPIVEAERAGLTPLTVGDVANPLMRATQREGMR
jgi:hypothetical protein